MRDYVTIIRDYFTDYFTDYFAIILRLLRLFYRRLYAIISRRRHPENGKVQKAILDPITEEGLVSVHEECLRIRIDWKARRQNGKLPDGASMHYYTHYFVYYTHYLSWLNLNVGSAGSSYALRFYAHPF